MRQIEFEWMEIGKGRWCFVEIDGGKDGQFLCVYKMMGK